jgi:hypothetical protein
VALARSRSKLTASAARPDIGLASACDAALPISSVDILIPNVVVRYLDDLINIAVMAGIESVECREIERQGITPTHASARTTVDPYIPSGGDGQFRQPYAAQSETKVVSGDDRGRSRRSECRDLYARSGRRRRPVFYPTYQQVIRVPDDIVWVGTRVPIDGMAHCVARIASAELAVVEVLKSRSSSASRLTLRC